MNKFLSSFGVFIVSLLFITFTINSCFRVASSEGRSWGIIEDWLFDKPWDHALFGSDSETDSEHFKVAANASAEVADLIIKEGSNLLNEPEYESKREQAQILSESAYRAATSISEGYLKESNPDLPNMYKTYFVSAMDSWRKGFAIKDHELVSKGNSDYNTFLLWIQSHNRDDFKK